MLSSVFIADFDVVLLIFDGVLLIFGGCSFIFDGISRISDGFLHIFCRNFHGILPELQEIIENQSRIVEIL